jgi:hypothetical protein
MSLPRVQLYQYGLIQCKVTQMLWDDNQTWLISRSTLRGEVRRRTLTDICDRDVGDVCIVVCDGLKGLLDATAT